jgi:hypothetical protein
MPEAAVSREQQGQMAFIAVMRVAMAGLLGRGP